LAGGVTTTTNGPLFAFAAPLQVQGLGDVPVVFASYVPTAGASPFSFANLTPSHSPSEASAGDVAALMDLLSAWWSEWRQPEFMLGAEPRANAVPPPGPEHTNRFQQDPPPAPPVVDFQFEPAGNVRAASEVAPLRPAALVSPVVVLQAEEATVPSPRQDGSSSGTNPTARSRLTLIGAIFSSTLAAVFIWGRARRIPEPNDSSKRRKIDTPEEKINIA
jgi:hypothetical protein